MNLEKFVDELPIPEVAEPVKKTQDKRIMKSLWRRCS